MSARDWNPEKINSSHVKEAAQHYRTQGSYLPFHDSRSYDVLIDGTPYPPKAIASKAHEYATGRFLEPNEFGGSKDGPWHRRLKELGFQIVEKGGDEAIANDVSKSLELSEEKRLKKIAEANLSKPKQYKVEVKRFARNADVVAQRLYLAKGHCEECKKAAPFKRKRDNTPYLEVHHEIPLSEGGADTVENTKAMCPNCHSKVHDQRGIERQVE